LQTSDEQLLFSLKRLRLRFVSYCRTRSVSTVIGDDLLRVYHPGILSMPTQPGHPSVGRCNEYWQWFWPLLGRNSEFCVTLGTLIMLTY